MLFGEWASFAGASWAKSKAKLAHAHAQFNERSDSTLMKLEESVKMLGANQEQWRHRRKTGRAFRRPRKTYGSYQAGQMFRPPIATI
jgi:hypothetical protein